MAVTKIKRIVTGIIIMVFFVGCKMPTKNDSESKIVGGQVVSADSTGPERSSTVGLQGCTGAIVAIDLILTAAHCYNSAISGGYVVFGTTYSSTERRLIQISGAAINRTYSGPGSDVSLLRLASPIPSGFRPIPIYPQGQPIYSRDVVRLAGYGSDNTPNSFGILRSVDSFIRSRAADGSLYVENGSTAACTGDSGGPVYLFRDGQWYTAGVISTAFMDQNNRCVGGNRFAPVQENYAVILDMAQRLTGRMQPFAAYVPTPELPPSIEGDFSMQEPVAIRQVPEFSFQTNSLVEATNSFTMLAQNTSSTNGINCVFRMEITRRNFFFPTTYTVEAKVEEFAAAAVHSLQFDDYMASLKGLLGAVSTASMPNFLCNQS